MTTDTIPTLHGIEITWLDFRRQEQRSTIVYCDRCGVTHVHGSGEGHRVAHCGDGGYASTGYYVKVITWSEQEFRAVIKDLIKARKEKLRRSKQRRKR